MTASVPSSFNPEELQRILDAKSGTPDAADFEQRIQDLAIKALDFAEDSAGEDAIMVHKMVVLAALSRFCAWHSGVSERMMREGEYESALAWARDAGKFQAMMDIIIGISMGSNDFTFTA